MLWRVSGPDRMSEKMPGRMSDNMPYIVPDNVSGSGPLEESNS